MLIESLKLKNFLSFGPNSPEFELGDLNVIIGPNGSGKSNLIEAINLLRATPNDLIKPIRALGGIGGVIWKDGKGGSKASIEALVKHDPKSSRKIPMYYHLELGEMTRRPLVFMERIETKERIATPNPDLQDAELHFYFDEASNRAEIGVRENGRTNLKSITNQIDREQSILSQRKDPDQFPELTYLGNAFEHIRIYRNWSFGPHTPPRTPQPTDLPNKLLEEDASNLGLVLNYLRNNPSAKKKLLKYLRKLYEEITDFDVHFEGNTIQVVLEEGDITVPATRLSEGTLRYLCLLAILCHPKNPALICIEEPELGLHPDILPTLAEMLRDASERMQIIVTTHSDRLVDELTDMPESVLVTEKHDGQTIIKKLNKADLDVWLEEYSLGELWARGELGGNRW